MHRKRLSLQVEFFPFFLTKEMKNMENWRNLAGKSLFPKHQLRGLRFIVVTCVQYIFKVKLHIKIMCKDAFF